MTGPSREAVGPPPKENPESLVLRGRPRPAVRFRRGVIVGTTGAVAAALVTLSWFALDPPSFRKAAEPVDGERPAGKAAPDALAKVPSTYGDVPRLGPPLPGDLGPAMLDRRRSLAASNSGGESTAAEAERERRAAARQAALSSGVLVHLERSSNGSPSKVSLPVQSGAAAGTSRPGLAAGQGRKIEFAHSRDGDLNAHELRPPPSPWTLSAGTIIPATLITGLNSDLPGTVLAQVSANVRDSATGRTTLIPQGARLIGSYDSLVAYGQRRALLVWKRLVFPDGSSVRLDNMPATDASGYAGLEDSVDSHTWQLLKGIGLSTLLGVSTQLSFGGGGDLVRAIRESAQQNAGDAGDLITARNLDVQPTIRVRPGWPVRVLVSKDLVLRPWRE